RRGHWFESSTTHPHAVRQPRLPLRQALAQTTFDHIRPHDLVTELVTLLKREKPATDDSGGPLATML
ncbi:MAG TPA: hypothetical protein VGN32_05370, partial [Ktedonobacterales bacterium]|nr:hypothetical protein [Ktedonobacterales bacterium]